MCGAEDAPLRTAGQAWPWGGRLVLAGRQPVLLVTLTLVLVTWSRFSLPGILVCSCDLAVVTGRTLPFLPLSGSLWCLHPFSFCYIFHPESCSVRPNPELPHGHKAGRKQNKIKQELWKGPECGMRGFPLANWAWQQRILFNHMHLYKEEYQSLLSLISNLVFNWEVSYSRKDSADRKTVALLFFAYVTQSSLSIKETEFSIGTKSRASEDLWSSVPQRSPHSRPERGLLKARPTTRVGRRAV